MNDNHLVRVRHQLAGLKPCDCRGLTAQSPLPADGEFKTGSATLVTFLQCGRYASALFHGYIGSET